MRIPVNITGGTYESPAVQLSAELTRNWHPEIQKDGSYVLSPWYGYNVFGIGAGSDRGMLFHRGVLYRVTGITLYSVDSAGVHTSLGTIQGSAQCILRGLGANVLIANGSGLYYEYNGSTVSQLTDPDLEQSNWLEVLKNFVIYGGENDRFVVSAFNDASDVSALDYANAETKADNLVRGYAFNEELYLFGERTLERWFASGVGRPPFAFRDMVPIGLASRMSVANNDQYMYWLSDDRKVYRLPGLQPVDNVGLGHVLENYTTVDDATGFCCKKDGQNFYHLSFPTEDATWVYSEQANEWFNLSRNTTSGRDTANSYAFAYGKHLVGDYSTARLYEWDDNAFTEDWSDLQEPPENVSTAPNDFTDAAWVDGNTPVVTANTDVAPDGTTTADTVEDNDASLGEYKYQDYTVADITASHTFSLFIKKDTTGRATRFPRLYLIYSGSTTESNQLDFDTSTGDTNVANQASDDFGYSVEDYSSTWWRVRLSAKSNDSSNTSVRFSFYPAVGAGADWSSDPTTTGSIVVWGGVLYETDSVYNEIERERITRPLDGNLLGFPGASIELNRFELFCEMGVGNLNETDPKICLQVSTNRGRTFGTERWASVGKSGEFQNRVIWNNLGRAESFVFKVKASDNAQFLIRNAALDFEYGY